MKKIFLLFLLVLLASAIYSQVPGPPTLISPPNGGTLCPPYILDWSDVPTATSYRIQISMNSNFTQIIVDEYTIISQYTIPNGALSTATIVYWHVSAINSYGQGQWSSPWQFRLGSSPVLLIPPNGAVNVPINPTLDWNDVPGATAYIVHISKSPLFDTLVFCDTVPPYFTITLEYGTKYYWRVCGINVTSVGCWSNVNHFTTLGSSVINMISSEIPSEYKLYNNYPNPFNPNTIIRFQIKDSRLVTLKVFDILGREVEILVNEKQTPGTYEVNFNASNLPSGIYFYTIRSGDFTDTKRMLLVK